jgi:hypothetical protein
LFIILLQNGNICNAFEFTHGTCSISNSTTLKIYSKYIRQKYIWIDPLQTSVTLINCKIFLDLYFLYFPSKRIFKILQCNYQKFFFYTLNEDSYINKEHKSKVSKVKNNEHVFSILFSLFTHFSSEIVTGRIPF